MSDKKHLISLSERELINIDGVKKVISFDDDEFLLDTELGPLEVRGHNLEIIKLDTYQETINIKGVINALSYLNEEGVKKEGLLSKLFK